VPFALQLYAHALDPVIQKPGGTEIFRRFTSLNARKLHNLQPSSRQVCLVRNEWEIPDAYQVGSWQVMAAGAKEKLLWTLQS
jgi:dihydroorotase